MSKWHKNWFSNMEPFDEPLVEGGIYYKTVENYYQAQKLLDLSKRREISLMNPYQAKKAIRNKELYLWITDFNDELKLKVMKKALKWKFKIGTSWYEKLMDTGNEEIVEWNNWGDVWWGKDLTTKKGRNELGKLLMDIRFELKNLNICVNCVRWGGNYSSQENYCSIIRSCVYREQTCRAFTLRTYQNNK